MSLHVILWKGEMRGRVVQIDLFFDNVVGGVPQSSRTDLSDSRGNTPHKVGEEKRDESKAKTANFGKD